MAVRLALHWRGRPLLAVDLTAHTPDDETTPPPGIEASGAGQFERAEPMEAPDTSVRIGFGNRPKETS